MNMNIYQCSLVLPVYYKHCVPSLQRTKGLYVIRVYITVVKAKKFLLIASRIFSGSAFHNSIACTVNESL
uniref:Uncharacterized protein n=1 Tax=Pararge aegeria TaxID=116150 RepID=S4NQS1_9NEOP